MSADDALFVVFFIDDSVSWHHIVSAVKHEMFTRMGTVMDAVIHELEGDDERKFDPKHLEEKGVKMVIDGMKKKRKMRASEVKYIEGLVQRAKEFKEQS